MPTRPRSTRARAVAEPEPALAVSTPVQGTGEHGACASRRARRASEPGRSRETMLGARAGRNWLAEYPAIERRRRACRAADVGARLPEGATPPPQSCRSTASLDVAERARRHPPRALPQRRAASGLVLTVEQMFGEPARPAGRGRLRLGAARGSGRVGERPESRAIVSRSRRASTSKSARLRATRVRQPLAELAARAAPRPARAGARRARRGGRG